MGIIAAPIGEYLRRRGLLESAEVAGKNDINLYGLPSIFVSSNVNNRDTRELAHSSYLAIEDVEDTGSIAQKAIEIYVSSPWSKRGGATVSIRQDRRWAFLRGLIKNVIVECHSRVRASPGEYKLDIRLHRLRGRHGMNLLSTLRGRIGRADALVMDLAGRNPNVMIEVGMAVAMHKEESGALIILKPKNEPWPSNLQGIVYCNYDKSLRRGLEDQAGFRAALRTRILKVAADRRMTTYNYSTAPND